NVASGTGTDLFTGALVGEFKRLLLSPKKVQALLKPRKTVRTVTFSRLLSIGQPPICVIEVFSAQDSFYLPVNIIRRDRHAVVVKNRDQFRSVGAQLDHHQAPELGVAVLFD